MATWLEVDRATLPRSKALDLTGYQLLIVGSKELPLEPFLETLRNCQDMKNLAKHWRNLGARLGVPPKEMHELGKEDASLKKSQAIYELIRKWSNMKRKEGRDSEANLKKLIECIEKMGTFYHIARDLRRQFQKQVKSLLGNCEKEELKEKSKEVPAATTTSM